MIRSVLALMCLKLNLLKRVWYFWVIQILILAYSIYCITYYLYLEGDPGSTIKYSSYIVTLGMLNFTILGYRNSLQDKGYNVYFSSINVPYLLRNVVNLIIVNLINLLFVSINLLYILIYYVISHANINLYIDTLLYLLNNWCFPFLISSILGLTIGLLNFKKFGFLMLIIICLLLTPINNVLIPLFSAMNIRYSDELLSYFNNINVSIIEPDMPYNTYFGEEIFWLKKLIFTIFLIIIFVIVALRNQVGNGSRNLLFLSIISVLLLNSLNPYVFKNEKSADSYYQPLVDIEKESFKYQINSYNIDIYMEKRPSYKVNMKITQLRSKKIIFSLYQGFSVLNITLNNKKLHFNTVGDFIIVQLPERLDSFSIEVSYIENQKSTGLFLPINYGWLPSNSILPTRLRIMDQPMQKPNLDQLQRKYTLKIHKSKKPIFTNINKTSEGAYEGYSDGLSVFAGNLKTKFYKGYSFIYPYTWLLEEAFLDKYLLTLQQVLKDYNQSNNTNYELPKKIYMMPLLDRSNSNLIDYMSLTNNLLIVQLEPSKVSMLKEPIPLIAYQLPFAIEKRILMNVTQNGILRIMNTTAEAGIQLNKKLGLNEGKRTYGDFLLHFGDERKNK
ncbi:hypothetical protein [Neobacillus sp. OS1-33]|uniref:hypothetical protein n=1 Tax=Neobacillus sp. OS1-33 TaxID=3070683 RepID=UPI0027E0F8B2|nr:hypothetical protein [Neobacillus sp. OS1-33]WML27374.1 hypothetical protein RCG22_07095 [Neobacillus sp. OS1-33]